MIIFGKRIFRLDNTTSTQDALKEFFKQGEEAGAIAIAVEQSRGRGRRGNSWDSQAGKGLWMSVLLNPTGPGDFLTWLPLWGGIAVHNAITNLLNASGRHIKDKIRLKWPNDIMAGERKIGGIISETVQDDKGRQGVLMGVGVNLKHRNSDFPPHLRDSAISLLEVTEKSFSPDELLEELINTFEKLYALLQPVDSASIKKFWKPVAWGLNSTLKISSGGKDFQGKFKDLGPNGEIGLEIPEKGLRLFSTAEKISMVESK